MPKEILSTLDDTKKVAKDLAVLVEEVRVMTFAGNLGAGKTTLIQEICRELGVRDFVSSPSFGLVNEYQSDNDQIFHFDLYRVSSLEEAMDMGFLEYIDSGSICLIEWPEVALEALPEDAVQVKLAHEPEGKRSIIWES